MPNYRCQMSASYFPVTPCTMGWYHHEYTNESSPSGPDGPCSLPMPDLSREDAAREEIYVENGNVFHLCQRSKWLEAISSKASYFPPTFWSDGRFTRGTCVRQTLFHTANVYYTKVPGDWICLELNTAALRNMGIAIAVHRAPEPATDGQPAQCLKIYSGISVATLGLVLEVYALQRGSDGSFLGMLPDGSTPRMVGMESPKTIVPTTDSEFKVTQRSKAKTDAEQSVISHEPVQKTKRGFWRKPG